MHFFHRSRAAALWITLAVLLITSSCGLPDYLDTLIQETTAIEATSAPAAQTATLPASAATVPVLVYFTNPDNPDGLDQAARPDEALAAAIGSAQESVDMAIYSFSLDSIRDALLEARERGVKVRLVMERDNLDRRVPEELSANGLKIIGDEGDGRMHNKFVIIDQQEVWTGSMNFTSTGATQDNNNLVRIHSVRMAENYTTEFEEMFIEHQFGAGSPANTPYPAVDINGIPLEVYFSPDDGVENRLVELVHNAQTSITVMVFSFTSDALAEALLEQAKNGVRVRVVLDEEQAGSNTGGEYQRLKDAGIDVRLDGITGQMHHKVLVVDEKWVALGSYNFSRSAEVRNDENLIIAEDAVLAEKFLGEFEKINEQAKP